jgi:hypothetical protein
MERMKLGEAGMRSVLVAFAASSVLAGCTGMGGDPPKRPPVTVADQVQQVDASKIVGTWTCRELNPYPDVPRQVSTITYAKEGAFTANAQYDATTPPFGGMNVETTGRWTVQGERIVISDVKTSASSQDAFTNMMAGIASSLVNTASAQEQGSGDVLKLTPAELAFRPEGADDPPVYSCTR